MSLATTLVKKTRKRCVYVIVPAGRHVPAGIFHPWSEALKGPPG